MDRGFAQRVRAGLLAVPPSATGVLFVDLAALRRNYRRLKVLAAGSAVSAVVKANAYGTGLSPAVKALKEEGCKAFFVATLDEAEAIRDIDPGGVDVFVLDGLLPGTAQRYGARGIHPVLGSTEEFEEWLAFSQSTAGGRSAALHFDTGMNRLGIEPAKAQSILGHPAINRIFGVSVIMTHLACSDDPASPRNAAQLELFNRIRENAPASALASIASSGGIFLGRPYRLGMVRPGIALYGGRPSTSGPNPMEAVVWLYGRIAQVRWAEAGETVGYGATQTLKRRTKIATVTAGYADGFFRSVSASDVRNGPPGYTGSHRLPLLGRVSMDLITFDATDVPDEAVYRGGWIELLGERVTVDDFAAFAGTISYEVLTSLGRRYHRIYVDE